MTKPRAPRFCSRCKDKVYEAQTAWERIVGGFVPLRTGGGANQVVHYTRTGEVYHDWCLTDALKGEQPALWEGEP